MMKRIFIILSFLICSLVSFSQMLPGYTPGFSPRGNKTTVMEDWNLAARGNLFCPRFTDTTQANDNAIKDTCGRICYTYDVDNFWIRKCFPVKHWEQVGTGSNITNPTCGLAPGTGIVSYDSLLFFDVTAALYSLCCDHVVRTTHDTTIALPAADSLNPVFVAIVLGKSGVSFIRGIPAPSPELPQADSCQIILTYVLVNAGQTVPANITQTVIYDENFAGEWPVDSLHNVVGDTANTQFPVHGLLDFFISSYDTADNYIEFASQSGNINLNDYGLLKFYIRSQVTTSFRLSINWWLDGVQQTISLPINVSVTGGAYTTVVLPISYWSFINTATVNKLRISILTPSTQFPYFDWIQLQKGMTVGSSGGGGSTGVTNLTVDTLAGFAAFPVSNPTSNAHVLSNFLNAPPSTVWLNDQNVPAPGHYGTLNLSNTNFFSGQLAITNLQTICDGCYLGGQGGQNTAIPFTNDTTYVTNGLSLFGPSPKDTIGLGGQLRYNTDITDDGTHKFHVYGENEIDLIVGDTTFSSSYGEILTDTGLVYLSSQDYTGAFSTFISSPASIEINAGNSTDRAEILMTPLQYKFLINHNEGFLSYTVDSLWLTDTLGNNIFSFANNGQFALRKYGIGNFISGTPAYNLAVQANGTVMEAAAFTGITADNGLTANTSTNVELGGTAFPGAALLHNTFIDAGTLYKLQINGTSDSHNILEVNNFGNAAAVYGTAQSGTGGTAIYGVTSDGGTGVRGEATTGEGVYGLATTGNALYGISSTSGLGIFASSVSGQAAYFSINPSSTNSVATTAIIERGTSGTAADGIGESIDFNIQNTTGGFHVSNQLISKWTTDASATRTSQMLVTGVNNAITSNIIAIDGTGVVGIGNFSSFNSTRLDVVDNNVGAAKIVNISSTSTQAASNAQTLLNISLSGANATSSQTTYGINVSNSHSGTSNVNIGIQATISNDGSTSFGILGIASAGAGISGQSTSGAGGSFVSSSGTGINVTSTSNIGANINSSSGIGTLTQSTSNLGLEVIRTPASTNSIVEVARIQLNTSGGGASAGFGPELTLDAHNSANLVKVAGAFSAQWTTSTNGAEVSNLDLYTNNAGTVNPRFRITGPGSILTAVQGAIATNATDGFLYIPTCAGTPTGVPTTQAGMQAMVWDSTNHKLYVYDGSWLPMN